MTTNKANITEQLLAEKLQQLPAEISPKRDLWAGIDHALETQAETKKKLPWTGIAAATAMVSMVGWLSFQTPAPEQQNNSGILQVATELSAQHQQQKQALLVSYADQPVVVENWQVQMKELDDAALAIKAALKNSPNNQALLHMLQSVHQQQINLIEKAYKPRFQRI